jgi:hypothetical protein
VNLDEFAAFAAFVREQTALIVSDFTTSEDDVLPIVLARTSERFIIMPLDTTFFESYERKAHLVTTVLPDVLRKMKPNLFAFVYTAWKVTREKDAVEPEGGWKMPSDDPERCEIVSMIVCAADREVNDYAPLMRHDDGTATLGDWSSLQEVPGATVGGLFASLREAVFA